MSDRDTFSSIAIGFIVGAAVGLAIGVLYAPHSGKETRAIIREKAEIAKEKAEEIIEEAKEKAEVLAKGLPASPGAALGKVVFDADDAVEEAKIGNVIRVRGQVFILYKIKNNTIVSLSDLLLHCS